MGTSNYDPQLEVDVTIPGWVYTHLWDVGSPLPEAHRGLWQGTHKHTITMRMTLETRAKCLAYLEDRLRSEIEVSLYNYPPVVTSAMQAFELFYWGNGYEGEPDDD